MRASRSYNVAPALGLGVVLAAVLGTLASASTDMSGAFAIRVTIACGIFMAALTRVAGRDHPFPRFGAANVVTTVRATLGALAAGLVGEPAPESVLWVVIGGVVLVGVLDGLDGWLARRDRMESAFGARFDMETDAALILVLSLLVWQQGKAGPWVLLCGAMRYAFVAAGWVLPWLAGPLQPTRRGRSVAIGQYVGLGLALMPLVPADAARWVAAVTLVALTWSFGVDVGRLRRGDAARAVESGAG